MDESTRDKVCRFIVPKRELPSDYVTFRLPNAPSLQFYCVYGHGKETEVSIGSSWWRCYDSDEETNFRGHTGEWELIAVLLGMVRTVYV